MNKYTWKYQRIIVYVAKLIFMIKQNVSPCCPIVLLIIFMTIIIKAPFKNLLYTSNNTWMGVDYAGYIHLGSLLLQIQGFLLVPSNPNYFPWQYPAEKKMSQSHTCRGILKKILIWFICCPRKGVHKLRPPGRFSGRQRGVLGIVFN